MASNANRELRWRVTPGEFCFGSRHGLEFAQCAQDCAGGCCLLAFEDAGTGCLCIVSRYRQRAAREVDEIGYASRIFGLGLLQAFHPGWFGHSLKWSLGFWRRQGLVPGSCVPARVGTHVCIPCLLHHTRINTCVSFMPTAAIHFSCLWSLLCCRSTQVSVRYEGGGAVWCSGGSG